MSKIRELVKEVNERYQVQILSSEPFASALKEHLSKEFREDGKLSKNNMQMFKEQNMVSNFEEAIISSQESSTLEEIRIKAQALGLVIVPIEYTNITIPNEIVYETARKLKMQTYAMIPIMEYDLWREVTCKSKNVGCKFFPKQYEEIEVMIELIMSTQKNLYAIAIENSKNIELLAETFNANMQNLRMVFTKIDKNQKILEEKVNYACSYVIATSVSKILSNIKLHETSYSKEKAYKFFWYHGGFDFSKRNIEQLKLQQREYIERVEKIGVAVGKYHEDIYFPREYSDPDFEPPITPKQVEFYAKKIQESMSLHELISSFRSTLYEILNNKVENINLEIEEVELKRRYQELMTTKKQIEQGSPIVFHVVSKNPCEGNDIIFYNR